MNYLPYVAVSTIAFQRYIGQQSREFLDKVDQGGPNSVMLIHSVRLTEQF